MVQVHMTGKVHVRKRTGVVNVGVNGIMERNYSGGMK